MNKNKNLTPIIEIKAVTWNKESHGLFDYENSHYDMKKLQIVKPVIMFRMKAEVFCIPKIEQKNQNNDNEIEYLMSISKNPKCNDEFWIDIPGQFHMNNYTAPETHLIVRSLKAKDGRSQKGFQLTPGNIIKLGRAEYKVIELKIFENNKKDSFKIERIKNYKSESNNFYFNCSNQEIKGDNSCKYCLQEEISDNELENYMLYSCDCKGSQGGVHFKCLKEWIQHKVISKVNNNTITYEWKKFKCEVCHKDWPKGIIYKGENIELINVEKPNLPYIILEKLSKEANQSNSLSLIILNENETLKLGRGHNCDLRLSDISVSRIHAYLKFESNKFLIFDNDSKFGTLILIDNNYKITKDKAAVQIGRTVFTFVLKYVKSK